MHLEVEKKLIIKLVLEWGKQSSFMVYVYSLSAASGCTMLFGAECLALGACSTLAGSTVMLLTLPWVGSLILGRVDIVNGQGVDEQTSRFSVKSFWKQVCSSVS